MIVDIDAASEQRLLAEAEMFKSQARLNDACADEVRARINRAADRSSKKGNN